MAKSGRPNQRTRAKRAAQAAQQQVHAAQTAPGLAPADNDPVQEIDLIELSPVTKARLKALSIPHELAFRSNIEWQKACEDRADARPEFADAPEHQGLNVEHETERPTLIEDTNIKPGARLAGVDESIKKVPYMHCEVRASNDDPNVKPSWSKIVSMGMTGPSLASSKASNDTLSHLVTQKPAAKVEGKVTRWQSADAGAKYTKPGVEGSGSRPPTSTIQATNTNEPKGKGKGKAPAAHGTQDNNVTNDWEVTKRHVSDEPTYRTERPSEWPSYNPSTSSIPLQRPYTKCIDHYYDMASGRSRLRSVAERRALGLLPAHTPPSRLERDHRAREAKKEHDANPTLQKRLRRFWPTPARPLDFYRFPAEIRTLILRQVLTNDLPIPVTPLFRRLNPRMRPALDYRILHACHGLYAQGLPLYYQLNTFSMSLHDFGVAGSTFAEGHWPCETGQSMACGVQGVRTLHLSVRAPGKGAVYDWQFVVRCLRGFEGLRKVVLDVRPLANVLDNNEGGVMLEGSFESFAAKAQRREGKGALVVNKVGWCEIEVGTVVQCVAGSDSLVGMELTWEGGYKEGDVVDVPVAEGLKEMLEKGGIRIGPRLAHEGEEGNSKGKVADGCLLIGANDKEEAAGFGQASGLQYVQKGLDRHLTEKARY